MTAPRHGHNPAPSASARTTRALSRAHHLQASTGQSGMRRWVSGLQWGQARTHALINITPTGRGPPGAEHRPRGLSAVRKTDLGYSDMDLLATTGSCDGGHLSPTRLTSRLSERTGLHIS